MDAASWLQAGEAMPGLQLGGRRGALILVALALVAAWADRKALVFLILAVLGLAGAAKLWAELALRQVDCGMELAERGAFTGDSLRLQMWVANNKLLPLSWVRIRAAVPPALTPTTSVRRPAWDRGGYLQGVSALGWRSQASWQFEVPCRARGIYALGPMELASGDPFGFFGQRSVLNRAEKVVVFPRVVPLRRLGFPLGAGFGAVQQRRALQEDPSRAAGPREYRPGDPLRRVDWKTTAKQSVLHVRLLDPAAAPLLVLVLAADTFDFPWTRYREDLFELAVSALASVAWRALEDGWQVGLLANTTEPVVLPAGSSPRQLDEILNALAGVKPAASADVADFLAAHLGRARAPTYVLGAGRGTRSLQNALEDVRLNRLNVVLLYGDDPPPRLQPLPSYQLRQWDDLATTLEGPGVILNSR